jgi:two-component system response regulator TctD
VLRIGALTLDRSTRRVELGNSPIDLRRREMAVLETLMGRPGKVVPKDRMAAEVLLCPKLSRPMRWRSMSAACAAS